MQMPFTAQLKHHSNLVSLSSQSVLHDATSLAVPDCTSEAILWADVLHLGFEMSGVTKHLQSEEGALLSCKTNEQEAETVSER